MPSNVRSFEQHCVATAFGQMILLQTTIKVVTPSAREGCICQMHQINVLEVGIHNAHDHLTQMGPAVQWQTGTHVPT